MNIRKLALAGAVLPATMALAYSPAFAQPADQPGAQTVETVVVTAEKRQENLQDVPIAIGVVGAEQIRQLGATSLSDLSNKVPAFSIDYASGVDTVFIRGVGGGGRNIGFTGRAGVYLNGVYTGQVGAIDQSLSDITQVEVLRGPQGTLFGRNTVSGAVNIITAAPSDEFSGSVEARGGNYGMYSLGASVNGPIDGNKIMGKASVFTEHRRGFTKNLFDGDRNIGSIDTTTVRGTLRFAPTSRWTIDVAGDYTHSDSVLGALESVSSPTGAGAVDPFAPAPFQVNVDTPTLRKKKNFGGSVTVNYDFANGMTFTSITAYRIANSYRQTDNDYSPLRLLNTDYNDRFNQFTQEARIASSTDQKFRYVAGIFYLNELARTSRYARVGADAALVGLPVAPGAVVSNIARINTNSYAAFANINYDVLPRLTFNAGLRYTHEHRTLYNNLDGSQSGGLGIGTLLNFHDRAGENHVTPTVGLTYKATKNVNLYGKFSKGFKSGGWNVDFLNSSQLTNQPGQTGTPFAFKPETVNSYEVGIKSQLWQNRIRFNADGFIANYSDYQINQFITYPTVTIIQLTNAAKVKTHGVEASLEALLTDNLDVSLNGAYIISKFGSFPGGGTAGADATGNRLPYAPRFAGNISANYRVPVDVASGHVSLFGDYAYRSQTYSGQENTPDEAIPSYGLFNARLSWKSDNNGLEVSLWGRNLFNKRYLVNRVRDFLGTQTVTQGDPRTFGIDASYRF